MNLRPKEQVQIEINCLMRRLPIKDLEQVLPSLPAKESLNPIFLTTPGTLTFNSVMAVWKRFSFKTPEIDKWDQ